MTPESSRHDVLSKLNEIIEQTTEEQAQTLRKVSARIAALFAQSRSRVTQDPKYNIVDGQLVVAATGVPIPEDEPVFIFRAKDCLAADCALEPYRDAVKGRDYPQAEAHAQAIAKRIAEFRAFLAQHPERAKLPDSAPRN